jgi:cell division protein FtsB
LQFFFDNNIGTLPSYFETFCDGTCSKDAQGWRIEADKIATPRNVKDISDVVLMMKVLMENDGFVSFEYSTFGSQDSETRLQFFIDGIEQPLQNGENDDAVQDQFDIKKPSDSNTETRLMWIYHVQSSNPQDNNYATISQLEIYGAMDGAAPESIKCPPGTYSQGKQTICTECAPGSYSNEKGSSECKLCEPSTFSDTYGSQSCIECGAGTASSTGATTCETDCVFTSGKTVIDLSPLKGSQPVQYDNKFLLLSVCDKIPYTESCLIEGEPTPGYACIDDKNIGRVLSVMPNNASSDASIVLQYSKGSSPDCDGINTVVSFFCDFDQIAPPSEDTTKEFNVHDIGQPTQDPNTTGNSKHHKCDYSLYWKSYAACRVCTDSDYEQQESLCVGGVKKSFQIRKSACVGPNFKASISEECTDSLELPIFAIIGAGVVLLLLLFILGFLFYRHRKLSHSYQLLAEEKTKGVEMDEIDSDYEKTLEKATSELHDDEEEFDASEDDETDKAKIV